MHTVLPLGLPYAEDKRTVKFKTQALGADTQRSKPMIKGVVKKSIGSSGGKLSGGRRSSLNTRLNKSTPG